MAKSCASAGVRVATPAASKPQKVSPGLRGGLRRFRLVLLRVVVRRRAEELVDGRTRRNPADYGLHPRGTPTFRRSKTPAIAVLFSDVAPPAPQRSGDSWRGLLPRIRVKLLGPTRGLLRLNSLPFHLFSALPQAPLLNLGLQLASLGLGPQSLGVRSFLVHPCRPFAQFRFPPIRLQELMLRLRGKPIRLKAAESPPPLAPLLQRRDRQNRRHENGRHDHDPHPQRHALGLPRTVEPQTLSTTRMTPAAVAVSPQTRLMPRNGKKAARGYGGRHKDWRKKWERLVAAGGVVCSRCGGSSSWHALGLGAPRGGAGLVGPPWYSWPAIWWAVP